MTKVNRLLAMAGMAAMMCLGSNSLMAQAPGGGRGFNRAQFQQRMEQRLRDRLQITSDDEWNAVQPLIQKVMQAQREARMGGGMRFMFGRRGPGGPGGPGARNGNNQRQRRFRGPQPSPAAQALEQAIQNNAGNEAIEAALKKFVADRKSKEEALKGAQANLRKVVTPRQEAILTLMGML